jgi:predicted GNAT family acetyltransferase
MGGQVADGGIRSMSQATIRILQPGDEATLEAFLLPRIDSSMFLIGNMRHSGLVDKGIPYTGTYAAAFEQGTMVAVVAHYWNNNLVFQAPIHAEALCRAAVQASQRPIAGLIGPAGQVRAAGQTLGIGPSRVLQDETDKLYSLRLEDLIVPASLSSGELRGRRMAPGDLELVSEWRVGYEVEALGEQYNAELRQSCREDAKRSLAEGHTWVLEAGGVPVACSSFNTATKEAVQVGGIWTPPELRRRGYGRAVVAASLLDARSEGVQNAILFTAESNIAAQRAYEALGFRHIGDYCLALLRSPLQAG